MLPLECSDREQFISDNQEAFNYGAMEEFGLRDDHFEEDGQIISRDTIGQSIDSGEAYRIILDGQKVGGLVIKVDGEKGDKGDKGDAGQNGKDGANGKTPEFRVNENNLQWRYVGDEIWLNLYDLSILKGLDGADGKDGINGKDGVDGKDGADGKDGTNGTDGSNGEDGKTSYLHIKYSNDGGVTFTGNNGEDPGA